MSNGNNLPLQHIFHHILHLKTIKKPCKNFPDISCCYCYKIYKLNYRKKNCFIKMSNFFHGSHFSIFSILIKNQANIFFKVEWRNIMFAITITIKLAEIRFFKYQIVWAEVRKMIPWQLQDRFPQMYSQMPNLDR